MDSAAREFLAIALVLVYVGAVMVLFLFVVMMLDINIDKLRRVLAQRAVGIRCCRPDRAADVAGAVAAALAGDDAFGSGVANADNTRALGMLTFTEYVFPLQIAGVILLVAIIAAIALTLRDARIRRGRIRRSRSRCAARIGCGWSR